MATLPMPIGDQVRTMWRQQFNASPEPEVPLYVIGDIHGRFDLLFRMIAEIDNDARHHKIDDHVIVCVGDYVDRGPQSDRVINLLVSLQSDTERRIVTLKGNHEHMMLRFMEDGPKGRGWLAHGGYETMLSYGIEGITENAPDTKLREAGARLRAALGARSVAFLEGLELQFRSGNICVTHAGADPTREIDAQSEKALIWGSSRLKSRPRKDGIWVVHGHIVQGAVENEQGRINVDTGAYFSDCLSAAFLYQGEVRVLEARV